MLNLKNFKSALLLPIHSVARVTRNINAKFKDLQN